MVQDREYPKGWRVIEGGRREQTHTDLAESLIALFKAKALDEIQGWEETVRLSEPLTQAELLRIKNESTERLCEQLEEYIKMWDAYDTVPTLVDDTPARPTFIQSIATELEARVQKTQENPSEDD